MTISGKKAYTYIPTHTHTHTHKYIHTHDYIFHYFFLPILLSSRLFIVLQATDLLFVYAFILICSFTAHYFPSPASGEISTKRTSKQLTESEVYITKLCIRGCKVNDCVIFSRDTYIQVKTKQLRRSLQEIFVTSRTEKLNLLPS